jgi:hypothetical protein
MKISYQRFLLFIPVLVMFFASCQKEVTIDLPEPEARLVVEGWIEQDQYPVVAITRNSPYFSQVDSATLANLFILDAQVFVTEVESNITEQLQLDFSNAFLGVWPFICYKGSSLKGEFGNSYQLFIVAEGDTITGLTTITQPVFLDSIWWEPDNAGKPDNDSLGYIWAKYMDDPGLKQYFRLFTQRIGRDNSWVPAFGSVYDDMFFNGIEFTFNFYRGIPSLSDSEGIMNDEELFYFKKGDTVDVKITSIDREHFEFWRTIEMESFTAGNPFVYPVSIRHNVKGAVGVWGGYAATIYRMVIGE